MKLEELSSHPDNNRIYSPTDLNDLEKSLSSHGQLEPLAVTKSKRLISGHRRLQAMKNLGWEECDIRYVEPDNEIIALIEHNRHRQKTTSDILNEARFLEKEIKKYVGAGKYTNIHTGRKQGERLRTVMEISQRLGIGTTKLKQLMSISNYEPELVTKIDRGEISVSKAYDIVREKHIKSKTSKNPGSLFVESFKKLLVNERPSIDEVNKTIKETYPYCLELTGIDDERRISLIDHLEYLKQLDSREMMMVQKKDELEQSNISNKDLSTVKKLLPSFEELEEFFKTKNPIDNVIVQDTSDKIMNSKMWNTIKVCIHSQENEQGPGRNMSGFVGFKNKNGYRLLGIFSFHSDSHSLTVRDNHIGWTTEQNKIHRERIVNMNTCCPTQPFGFNFLGGKFVSMIVQKFVPLWNEKYKTKLVGITTTSLFGSESQYNSMRWWKHLGTSSGTVLIKPLDEEWSFWRHWLRENYQDIFDKVMSESSPKQRALSNIFRILNIPQKDYFHNHKRGVYFCPLYSNYREFLTGKIKEKDLQPLEILSDWNDWWIKKSSDRIKMLTKEKRINKDLLFHENITEEEMENWLSSRGIS